jgi:D-arabinose 1-dehydrogenase-like Zn-dependent alcohol dehydrogenase
MSTFSSLLPSSFHFHLFESKFENEQNRQDAIEALDFAARGKVKALISVEPLANLESVYHRMEKGAIPGRIVLSIN